MVGGVNLNDFLSTEASRYLPYFKNRLKNIHLKNQRVLLHLKDFKNRLKNIHPDITSETADGYKDQISQEGYKLNLVYTPKDRYCRVDLDAEFKTADGVVWNRVPVPEDLRLKVNRVVCPSDQEYRIENYDYLSSNLDMGRITCHTDPAEGDVYCQTSYTMLPDLTGDNLVHFNNHGEASRVLGLTFTHYADSQGLSTGDCKFIGGNTGTPGLSSSSPGFAAPMRWFSALMAGGDIEPKLTLRVNCSVK
jgi:hypothetical protein